MKKLQIQITDWGLSREKIGTVLSKELNLSVFSFIDMLKKQLRIQDKLTKKIYESLNDGELIPIKLISNLILRSLKRTQEDLLFTDFPRTIQQLNELNKISNEENFEIETIWYFKQKDPKQFLLDYLNSDKGKMRFNKYGQEVVDKWNINYCTCQNYISEMQKGSSSDKWKIVQVEYGIEFNEQMIKRKIKAYA